MHVCMYACLCNVLTLIFPHRTRFRPEAAPNWGYGGMGQHYQPGVDPVSTTRQTFPRLAFPVSLINSVSLVSVILLSLGDHLDG